MKKSLFVLAAGFGLILAAIPVFAHHSFAAQYDRSKQVTLTGSVTKVDWIVELASPNGLMRRGWTRNSLKIGAPVTVNGSAAKDGSSLANASTVTLSDGKRVFAGSSGDAESGTP